MKINKDFIKEKGKLTNILPVAFKIPPPPDA